MSRVKKGVVTKRRHRKLLKQAKGFWGQRKNVYKRAKETLLRALHFSYIGRKLRKRDFRRLFIARVNSASRSCGFSYSRLIKKMKDLNILINRKMLSQMAIFDFDGFKAICQS
jgi:large subunit ribosomal protein L20